MLFIEWNAVSSATRATDGIDTFVFEGDHIKVQTVRYTLEKPADSSAAAVPWSSRCRWGSR